MAASSANTNFIKNARKLEKKEKFEKLYCKQLLLKVILLLHLPLQFQINICAASIFTVQFFNTC